MCDECKDCDNTVEDVVNHFIRLFRCCWGNGWEINNQPTRKKPAFQPEDIVGVIHLTKNFPSHNNTAYGVLALKTGKYLAFWEGCDYSGHG